MVLVEYVLEAFPCLFESNLLLLIFLIAILFKTTKEIVFFLFREGDSSTLFRFFHFDAPH